MAYQALYRVYRPKTFQDVVGQEHITKTLQNALLQEKFSHAYLFSGPRGTGKTSAAKIFSKAVNCERAPISEPCNECDSCRGISDGSISDVIEIDAASNNGVDEIRDIRDKVKYAPSAVKYKVYIVDEVHMLSIGAFNALLKTLEEPPKHVIFILATTEPHKIPLTIISRCQRFDFRRINAQAIVQRMKVIIDNQEIEVEEQALHVIARAAEGGMRDALSLLDQAISYSDDVVQFEDVLSITGSVSQTFLTNLVEAIDQKNVQVALKTLDELMNHGKDPMRFIEDLIFYYRDMLLYQTAPNLEETLERVMVDDHFTALAERIHKGSIYEIIDILNKCQQEMKWTNHPRIFLEVAIVKLCQQDGPQVVQTVPQIDTLMNRINQLENELQQLKEKGIAVSNDGVAQPERKPQKSAARSGYKTPTGRLIEILKQATRPDLELLKSRWGAMLEQLRQQNKVSHAALLIDSEPVAASNTAFVLKFKYEIHCKMVAENNNNVRDNLENILLELTNKRFEMVAVPDDEWGKIREEFLRGQRSEETSDMEEEEDPLIAEAKKIVGTELIEIQE
ncbi:DNA polymerase III subunit gamma/tau [Bacillus luteolus]|uniref:DNA-directed DNA polymerase n=1 Tax=Litchfieldia luteola TaxID=682179 RepID=A0ABR9QH25_9BACI|nr:DNA polymerase III subunit gamma/tau [Cytobacillus luteolus]MBE4907794.1 DNA polymerase III subunit gamma/tau [Cytobacillus luteolus]MBP1944613.1 DNA polymerase-3 subunit gamma/tau [Cytobacillus luteolus]